MNCHSVRKKALNDDLIRWSTDKQHALHLPDPRSAPPFSLRGSKEGRGSDTPLTSILLAPVVILSCTNQYASAACLCPGFDQQHRHAHCYVAERGERLPAGIAILILRPEEITPFAFLLPKCRGGSSGSTGPVRERSGVSTVVAGSGLDCEPRPPSLP